MLINTKNSKIVFIFLYVFSNKLVFMHNITSKDKKLIFFHSRKLGLYRIQTIKLRLTTMSNGLRSFFDFYQKFCSRFLILPKNFKAEKQDTLNQISLEKS